MKDYYINVLEYPLSPLKIKANWDTLSLFGYIGDNLAHKIVFIRPEDGSRNNSELVLKFSDEVHTYESIVLGKNNSFIIPNRLTQTKKLVLQISFIDNEMEINSSNWIIFRFGESVGISDTPIIAPPNLVEELSAKAITTIDSIFYEDKSMINFKNIKDKIVQSLTIEGTGSIIQRESYLSFPNVGKITDLYIDNSNNKIFKWNNSIQQYQEIEMTNNIDIIMGGEV